MPAGRNARPFLAWTQELRACRDDTKSSRIQLEHSPRDEAQSFRLGPGKDSGPKKSKDNAALRGAFIAGTSHVLVELFLFDLEPVHVLSANGDSAFGQTCNRSPSINRNSRCHAYTDRQAGRCSHPRIYAYMHNTQICTCTHAYVHAFRHAGKQACIQTHKWRRQQENEQL